MYIYIYQDLYQSGRFSTDFIPLYFILFVMTATGSINVKRLFKKISFIFENFHIS